jgi:hypothetical protein
VSRAAGALRAGAVALLLAGTLAGCGGSPGSQDEKDPSPSATKPDVLLAKKDILPLVPTSVSELEDLQPGTQYYSCSEERNTLAGKGWTFHGRDLRNTGENWAIDSVVLENPDVDSASQVAQFRNQVDACNSQDDANLVEFPMGTDTFAYRSITPDKRVDTVRAYALVGEHRIVQVTVLGLNEHSAPDQIESLVQKAVQKAR